jgi:hypothetical protein
MAIQTATNPQTGETVALVNGQWVAVGQTATNDKGQKAYLVNNQWLTDQPAEPVKEAGFNLGDIAKSFGMGAVGSTKALTDVAGADNVVSSKLGDVSKSIQQSLSPERQAEMERQAARMKAAEESGSFLQEVKAGALNVAEAPLQSAAQAIGSFVPYLPALFAAPAAAAMRLSAGSQAAVRAVAQQAPKVIGTAQGAGAVKGSIYDGVLKAEIEAGADPEVAKKKADAAQSYFGGNFDQIALGAGLGYVAGSKGVEEFFTKAGRSGAAPGVARRIGETVLKESLPEAAQGGQERVAQNVALQREGYDVGTFTGAAGAATQEALTGALGAAPIAAISGPGAQPAAKPTATPTRTPIAPTPEEPVSATPPEAAPEPLVEVPPAVEPVAVEPTPPVAPVAPMEPAAQPEPAKKEQPKAEDWDANYTENLPPEAGTFFQNRDRSSPASVGQMQSIAANPDYSRLSVGRDFGSGAPVVISDLPISDDQFGKVAYATASDGTRIPVRYAVVEGGDVTPSNTSDGTKNPEYGDLSVTGIRPIAGNGRVAGLRAAYSQGTAENYKRELLEDTEHGINPNIISGFENPVLVRVMPKSKVTANIADISNISGTLRLSPVESAKNDINRVDLNGLTFNDDGSPNTNTLIQFVRSMPKDEQGELMDAKGMPNTKAIDRLNNAIFYKAYGSDTLIELYAQAADQEAKAVLNALAKAAPKMAALDGAGEYDVRASVLDAAEMAVNARRSGQKLRDYVQQGMLGADPYAIKVLEMFADNSRSSKRMAEALDRLATLAGEQAGKSGADMFGDVPKMPKDDLYKALVLEPEAGPDLFATPTAPTVAAPAAPAKPRAAAPVAAPAAPVKPKAAKPAEPTYDKAEDPQFVISKSPVEIAQEIQGLSVRDLAQWSVNNAPNEAARAIAQRVADRINELATKKVYPEKVRVLNNTQRWKSGTRGKVDLISVKGVGFAMKIGFNGTDNGKADSRTGTRYSTILHELIHAATVPQIFFAPNSKSVNDLKVLYKKVNDKIKQDVAAGNTSKVIEKITRGSNAMQNPAELMAWGLTDADFQKYLADIKIGDKTGFQKLVDIVRQVLGLAKDYESALDSLIKTTGEMMDVSLADAEQDMKASNIPMKGIRTKGGRLVLPEAEVKTIEEREARPLFFFDSLFKEQSESDRKQGYANRFKNPVTLKDGSRLSGFTDPKKQTTFHGYEKNGERFTQRASDVNPNDIVFSKDANKTANRVREALIDVYGALDVDLITTEQRVGKPTPTQAGQDALATLEATGMQLQPPDPGRIESIKKTLKAAGEDPAMTKSSAKAAIKKFLDKMEVAAFSGDAAFNNDIRRNLEADFADNPDVLGMLLEASQSQAVHADALATQFIVDGGIFFDTETKKWVSIKKEDNFIKLAKQIEKAAEKYGLNKEQTEQIAHTYFVAKRFKDLLKKQNSRDAEIDRLNAELEAENANIKQYKKDGDFEKLRTSERAKNDIKADIEKLEKAKVLISEDQRAMIEPGLSLVKNMPELEDISDTWQGIRANAVKAMIDGNLWSLKYAEDMLDNAAYVPFYRDEQLDEGGGPQEFIKGLQVKAEEFRLKGSNAAVNDVFDNMVRWTQYAINRSVRNHKALQMVDLGTDLKVGDRKMAEKVEKMDPKKNTIRVFRDGKQEIYSMADPLYVDAFSAISNVTIPSLKFFTWFSNALRQSVVLYPLFSVAQVPQDAISAMFTSGLKTRYALRIPVLAVKEFLKTLNKTSSTHNLLKSYGATGVRDFNATVARQDIQIAAGLKGAKGVGGKTVEMLSHIAMAADNSIRQAVYEASMQQGLSKGEAIEKAFDIINFRRRGTSKLVNLAGQTVPFFYAYMSVQRTAYKTLTGVGISPQKRKEALTTLATTSGAVMALSLFYVMMNGGDEEYEKTPTAIRDRTLNIPGTGGLRIPLRPDLFLMPKVLTEHLYHLITDTGLSDGAKFRKSVADGVANAVLSPQPIPQAVKPALEVAINYDFFQGRPLIGQFEKQKEAERQFNDNTSEFSKMLGQFGVSPIAADHMIRGMFGSAGGLFLYTTNFMINSDPDVPRPELSFRDAAAALPGTSGFVTKASENALKTDFYALRDEVEKVKNTYNDIKTRSPQELEQFLSDEKNIARLGLAKGTEKIGMQLSKIRRAINQITNAPEDLYSASEKKDAIKELREVEKEMLKSVDIPALRKMAMM